MDLPHAKHREKYIALVKQLETEVKETTDSGDISDLSVHSLQEKLDILAQTYQDDEKIGTSRYKLYELQAFIHYFNHQDEKAFEFINTAIEIKGGSYQKAEKLIEKLASDPKTTVIAHDERDMSKAEKRKKLIGLEGWLALFIVGQFITLAITAYRFFADGFLSQSDITDLNSYQAGLGDTVQMIATFENLMIVVYIALIVSTLVLLFRRRKFAKSLAITTLIFVTVYGIVDYAVATYVFGTSGLSQTSEIQTYLSKYAGDVGRSIIVALIWVPYFLVSKRVKATLTRE